MKDFLINSLRNAGILALAFLGLGVFFWDRSVQFMISSLLKNIPFLLIGGAILEMFKYIDRFFDFGHKNHKEIPDRYTDDQIELMKSVHRSTGISYDEIRSAFEKAGGDEDKMRVLLELSDDKSLVENLSSHEDVFFRKEYRLPDLIDCPSCGEELELEEQERKERKFTCPECDSLINVRIEKSTKSFDGEVASEQQYNENHLNGNKYPENFCPRCIHAPNGIYCEKFGFNTKNYPEKFIKNCLHDYFVEDVKRKESYSASDVLFKYIDCPKCGDKLELEKEERISKQFTCPLCDTFIDLN